MGAEYSSSPNFYFDTEQGVMYLRRRASLSWRKFVSSCAHGPNAIAIDARQPRVAELGPDLFQVVSGRKRAR